MGGPGSGGANRKPTRLHVLRGDDKRNPQRYRKVDHSVVQPLVDPPEAPDWLDDEAAAYWRRTAPLLVAAGALTAWDLDAFAMLAASWSLWRRAAGVEARQMQAAWYRLAIRFGLVGPQSRDVLPVVGAPPAGNDWESLLT